MSQDTKLTNYNMIAFAMPSFVTALLYSPIAYILPTIYAKYYSIDLAFIGTVLMVSRIFDAVTDPVIGYLSDKTKTRFGNRKPWIVVGFMLLIIAIYNLFIPPEPVRPMYFMIWFLLMFLFLTMAEIPYWAWQAEITRDYRTRSRLSAVKIAFSGGGGLLFAVMPLLPIFATNEMTPEVLKVLALVIAVLLPVSILICVIFAPQGKKVTVKADGTIQMLLRDFVRNKPLLIFVACYLFSGLASGMQVGLGFLYFDTYLGIGDKFPVILIAISAIQLLSMPVWLRLMNKYGKHRAFAVGRVLAALSSIGLIFLKPGPSIFPIFMVIWCFMMFMFAAQAVVPPAIMGDIIDYDVLKSGRNRAGQYNAVYLLITKLNVGLGAGFAFYLVDFFGYDAAATVHDRTSIFGMWFAIAILPAVLFCISSIILWQFPIDERRQKIIRKRIETCSGRLKIQGEI